jgi:hypothetical protein
MAKPRCVHGMDRVIQVSLIADAGILISTSIQQSIASGLFRWLRVPLYCGRRSVGFYLRVAYLLVRRRETFDRIPFRCCHVQLRRSL